MGKDRKMLNDELSALSPLDGRYLPKTSQLRDYFSEASLIKHRILAEALYLIKLIDFLRVAKLTPGQKKRLLKWVDGLTLKELTKVKKIEEETNHDVKAVEYFLKFSLKKLNLEKFSSWVHWGLTSEDTNNLAYGLMIQEAKNEVLVPSQLQLIELLTGQAKKYAGLVMPGRTHGQIAVPTTVGKELIIFASRASFFIKKIIALKMDGKLNGAVGNFNCQQFIFPQKNWPKFSHNFISSLGLKPVMITTQIKTTGRLVYFFDLLRELNNIWLNLARDCWFYISLDYFVQQTVAGQVGSSTMPHKVNPIDFENAEGNLELAGSLLAMLANKLSYSRLQRDLSDSTVMRNVGTAFGYSLLAVRSLIKGLGKIMPNKKYLAKEVVDHPEMLTEALQLILKIWGKEKAYEEIKERTRGKKVFWLKLINQLGLTKKQTKILSRWQTKNYIGLAKILTLKEIKRIKKIILRRRKK